MVTETLWTVPPFNGAASPPPPPAPRPRIRGLRLPALPSWPLLAQVGGGAAALWGVWAQFGGPVAGMVGGIAAVAVGALREAGKI